MTIPAKLGENFNEFHMWHLIKENDKVFAQNHFKHKIEVSIEDIYSLLAEEKVCITNSAKFSRPLLAMEDLSGKQTLHAYESDTYKSIKKSRKKELTIGNVVLNKDNVALFLGYYWRYSKIRNGEYKSDKVAFFKLLNSLNSGNSPLDIYPINEKNIKIEHILDNISLSEDEVKKHILEYISYHQSLEFMSYHQSCELIEIGESTNAECFFIKALN